MFRSSLLRSLLGVLLRGALWSAFAIAVSLPLVRAIHHHFGLGEPPFNGVVILSFGVFAAFLGAGLGGALVGLFAGHKRGPVSLFAAFGGLMWGLGVLMWLAPAYGALVVDEAARSGATMLRREGNDLVPRGQSAIQAFQEGQKTKVAPEPFVDEEPNLTIPSTSKLPALSILGWALIGAPLLAAWECRGARQR